MDSLRNFLKFIFIILIFHTCGYVNVNTGVHRGQRHWMLLELELEAVVSQQMWMLWPSLRVYVLKLRGISIASSLWF